MYVLENITNAILSKIIHTRQNHTHKGNFGRLLIIGGNSEYGGAVIMNTIAAVNSGAGLVTVATDKTNFTAIHNHVPEAMVIDFNHDLTNFVKKSDVILIGSGLGDRLDILENVLSTIKDDHKLIIDGSAITMLATHQLTLPNCELIMTPHQMEWQRLSGIPIIKQSEERLNQFARATLNHNCILVLKQFHTEIYTNTGAYKLNIGGPYQATGGMGDTLAGIIAGFVGQFHNDPLSDVVMAAVFSHSAIAEELSQTQYVVLPTRISQQLPEFMKRYTN